MIKTIISCDSCGKSREGFDSGALDFFSTGIYIQPYPLLNTVKGFRGSCLLCVNCARKLSVFRGYFDERETPKTPEETIKSLETMEQYGAKIKETDYI